MREVLTLEHIASGPPCLGMERLDASNFILVVFPSSFD